MEYIKDEAIAAAIAKNYRQYLTGNLHRPQPFLQHISDDIEVGISWYQNFTADTPHVHPHATEHVFVLSGSIKCRLLNEPTTEYVFHQGDFFTFRPGEPHATKNDSGTKVLFIKSPSINDKTIVPVDEETEKWMRTWDGEAES